MLSLGHDTQYEHFLAPDWGDFCRAGNAGGGIGRGAVGMASGAEHYVKRGLHAILLRETEQMSADMNELGYTITPWPQPGCTHEYGFGHSWLPEIGCQDISVIYPKGSLAEVQKNYAVTAANLAQGLEDRSWQQQGDGTTGLVYTKQVGAVLCRLYVMPTDNYSSNLECDRRMKVPTISVPFFFELYGGG